MHLMMVYGKRDDQVRDFVLQLARQPSGGAGGHFAGG